VYNIIHTYTHSHIHTHIHTHTYIHTHTHIDVDVVTFGQYLRPTKRHMTVQRYVTPAEFDGWREEAQAMGFRCVQWQWGAVGDRKPRLCSSALLHYLSSGLSDIILPMPMPMPMPILPPLLCLYSLLHSFRYVASGPLVRSSYRAGELFLKGMLEGDNLKAQEQQETGAQ
jgi:hypothetical protein